MLVCILFYFNHKNLHWKTACCVYLCCLSLILKFVWWSETFKCDKHAKKNKKSGRGQTIFHITIYIYIYMYIAAKKKWLWKHLQYEPWGDDKCEKSSLLPSAWALQRASQNNRCRGRRLMGCEETPTLWQRDRLTRAHCSGDSLLVVRPNQPWAAMCSRCQSLLCRFWKQSVGWLSDRSQAAPFQSLRVLSGGAAAGTVV